MNNEIVRDVKVKRVSEVEGKGLYIPFISAWVKLSEGTLELLKTVKLEELNISHKIIKHFVEKERINNLYDFIFIESKRLNRIKMINRISADYTKYYIKKCLIEIENGVYQKNKSLFSIIDGIINLSNDKTKEILLTRWSKIGINSYREVSKKEGLSREGIRQIVIRRIATLKAEFNFYLQDFLLKIREYLEENFKRVVIDEFTASEKVKWIYDPKLYFGILYEIYPFIPIEGFEVNYFELKKRTETYQTLIQMYEQLMKLEFTSHGLFIEQIYEKLNITSDEDKIKLFYLLLESKGFIFEKDSNNRYTIRRMEN